jgi:protein-disulfide isomerase
VEPVAPARHRAGEPTIASLPHPTARTLFLVAALAVAIPAAELHFYGALQNKSIADAANNELREVVEDTQQLYAMYLNNAKHQFPDLDDDPIWQGTGDLPLVTAQMVVFSDFQCPHCRDFEKYMSDQVLPLFHGGMKVTFKHFPMDQSCNEELKKTLHPQACEAATAAEAALILGGNDAFWKAHDLLFASQADLRKFDYAAFAQQLGLDPEAFNKTRNDPATMERVKRDIALAREVGVDATPSLFLSGRRVPRLAVRQFRFWEAVAKVYDNALQYAIKQREKKEAAKSETGADSNAEPESEEPEHNEPQASTRPREVKRLTLTPSNPNP